MAQQLKSETTMNLVVAKRGNGKARGVIYDGTEYKIGEKFTAKVSDAKYFIASGKCELAAEKAAEPKK